jgi:hypothetical protein
MDRLRRAPRLGRRRALTHLVALITTVSALVTGALTATAQATVKSVPTTTEVALQAQLESELESFRASELPDAEQRECTTVLTPFHRASTDDQLLRNSLDTLRTEQQALSAQEKADYGIVIFDAAALLTDVAAFFEGLPVAQKELEGLTAAAQAEHLATQQLEAVATLFASIDKAISGLVIWLSPPSGGNFDNALTNMTQASNAVSLLVAGLNFTALVGELKGLAGVVGGLAVQGVLGEISVITDFLALGDDLEQAGHDLGAHGVAAEQAYGLYRQLLLRLQGDLADAQAAMTSCHPLPTNSSVGPVPQVGGQSRCAALTMTGGGRDHVFLEDDTISFTVPGKHAEACFGSADWDWNLPGVVPKAGCKHDDFSCTGRVTPTSGYVTGCLSGSSGFGPWSSCVYYAGVAKGTAVVQGNVTDRDGSTVGGVTVNAQGTGQTTGDYATTTGPDGYFAIIVKEGSYLVSAQHLTGVAAGYVPAAAAVSVAKDDIATSNFVLQSGLSVQISLSPPGAAKAPPGASTAALEVPANGSEVVQGLLTVRLYGKPDPNEDVQLTMMGGHPGLVSAPKVAVCGPSGRIWPAGNLTAPVTDPVLVTTGDDGTYSFSLTVGTRPGAWSLQAAAFSNLDAPSQDPADASAQAVVDLGKTGGASIAGFAQALDEVMKGSPALQKAAATGSVGPLAGALGDLPPGGPLGGLAFAVGYEHNDGTQVIIVSNASVPPPATGANQVVTPAAGDIIIDPAEFTGPTSSSGWAPAFYQAAASGDITNVPNYTQWKSGAKLKDWALAPDSLQLTTTNFEWYGWAYGGLTTPGACS